MTAPDASAVIAPDSLNKKIRRDLFRRLALVKDEEIASKLMGIAKEDKQIDATTGFEESPSDAPLSVCDTQMIKGLEYDAVILVEPGEIAQDAPSRLSGAADLYVALTRPTQRLVIVETQNDKRLLDL